MLSVGASRAPASYHVALIKFDLGKGLLHTIIDKDVIHWFYESVYFRDHLHEFIADWGEILGTQLDAQRHLNYEIVTKLRKSVIVIIHIDNTI